MYSSQHKSPINKSGKCGPCRREAKSRLQVPLCPLTSSPWRVPHEGGPVDRRSWNSTFLTRCSAATPAKQTRHETFATLALIRVTLKHTCPLFPRGTVFSFTFPEIKRPREGVPATYKEASILTVTVKDTRAETTPDGSPDRLGLEEIPNPTTVRAFSCTE